MMGEEKVKHLEAKANEEIIANLEHRCVRAIKSSLENIASARRSLERKESEHQKFLADIVRDPHRAVRNMD